MTRFEDLPEPVCCPACGQPVNASALPNVRRMACCTADLDAEQADGLLSTLGIARVPLGSRRGPREETAFVDVADVESVARYRWTLHSVGYAIRGGEEGGTVFMHRSLLGLERGDRRQADHINRNRLDNRRSNLRIVTHHQNHQNISSARESSSRFRGVTWVKASERWLAQVKVRGKNHNLGVFRDEFDAALRAEAFRREHFPYAEPDPVLEAEIERRQAERDLSEAA